MEVIGSILSGLFIALILATAFTFGFMLLVWFIVAALAMALLFVLREWWRRWMFVRRGKMQERGSQTTVRIIEAEYEDLSDKK